MINSIKDNIKKNKYYYLVMCVFTLLFSMVVINVVLYADDFLLHYKALSYDINVVINEIKDVYLHWGGGPTPGFAILMLMAGLNVWKFINVLMIFFTVSMTVKLLFPKGTSDKERAIFAGIIWALILIINISVARETLYWFDGSMAYVLTTFLTLAFFYYLYMYYISNKDVPKFMYPLLPILAFFAGWNSPQGGAIAVLLAILIILWRFLYNHKKIPKLLIVSTIFVIIGFGVLYFAPGNDGRMSEFVDYANLGLIDKVVYRLPDIFRLTVDYNSYNAFNLTSFVTILAFFVGGYVFINKDKFKKRKIIINTAVIIIFLYELLFLIHMNVGGYNAINHFLNNLFDSSCSPYLGFSNLLKYFMIYGFFSLFIISIIYLSFEISLLKKKPLLFMAGVGGLGTQAIMVMAPYSPFRSTYISIIFLIIAIVAIIKEYKGNYEEINILWIASLYFYEISLGIILTAVFILFKYLNIKQFITYSLGILSFLVISNMFLNIYGYYCTSKNNKENIKQIEEFKEHDQKGTLVLYKSDFEDYMFTPIYSDIDWIRRDVKIYFDLNEDVEIDVVTNNG